MDKYLHKDSDLQRDYDADLPLHEIELGFYCGEAGIDSV